MSIQFLNVSSVLGVYVLLLPADNYWNATQNSFHDIICSIYERWTVHFLLGSPCSERLISILISIHFQKLYFAHIRSRLSACGIESFFARLSRVKHADGQRCGHSRYLHHGYWARSNWFFLCCCCLPIHYTYTASSPLDVEAWKSEFERDCVQHG